MDEKKEYYGIITEIWKAICDDFDAIEASAPEHMKRYAGEMVLLHVDELERRWRH